MTQHSLACAPTFVLSSMDRTKGPRGCPRRKTLDSEPYDENQSHGRSTRLIISEPSESDEI